MTLNFSFFRPIAALVIALLLSSCATRTNMPPADVNYDYKIINARIVDGSGAPAYMGGLLIHDGFIHYAGAADLTHYTATQHIDAAGRIVSPGFIDAHAHGNAEMNPEFRNFWSMGVTTIFLGMDGSSPGVDDLPDWMQRVTDARPGVNVAHFVGHGTARTASGIDMRRNPEDVEIATLAEIVRNQLESGSFGVSKGIEYIPGVFAGRQELASVGAEVARHDGFVTSHVRNEDADAVKDAIRELIEMGSDSGARVHVSHIKIVYGADVAQAEAVLALLDSARAAGIDITADVYPYTASYTGISILYPEWALPPNDYARVVQARRAELATYLRDRVNRRNGPEATLLGTAPWAGKTLAEVASEMNKPFEEVLIDHIPPGSASAAYFVMNIDVMRRFLQDPHVMVSSDGSPTMLHPRGYGSFARIIRQFVVEEGSLTLEQAVYKMSGQTAALARLDQVREADGDLRLAPRGLLRAGFAADVLIFDPNSVRDTATFEQPHQYATGFDYVFVNGSLVREDGQPTGKRSGVMLLSRNLP